MQCRACDSFIADEGEKYLLSEVDVVISHDRRAKVNLIKCDSCSLVQVSSLQTPESITELYENLVDEGFELERKLRERSYLNDLRRLRKIFDYDPRILEVGAFTGVGASAIERVFKNSFYLGIEPSLWAVKKANGKNIMQGAVGSLLPEKDFDLVVAWDVIEHLENPREFFYWIKEYTKPGAILFLSTPNYNSPWRWLFGRRWWFVSRMHRTYFTLQTLSHFVKQMDWQCLRYWSFVKYRSLRYLSVRLFACIGIQIPQNWINLMPDWCIRIRPGQMNVVLKRMN